MCGEDFATFSLTGLFWANMRFRVTQLDCYMSARRAGVTPSSTMLDWQSGQGALSSLKSSVYSTYTIVYKHSTTTIVFTFGAQSLSDNLQL